MNVVDQFRQLHESGTFVMPNPWDAGTAIYLKHVGFKAIATTSAGAAFSRGLQDEIEAMSRDDVLAHIRDLVRATSLPVNADFQNGHAAEPEQVAANVVLCVETGAAGLSIEDATGDANKPLYDTPLAIERIRAARAAINASNTPGVVLTARCEAFLVHAPNAQQIVLDRLVAFAEAGADCVFAPGITTADQVATLVKAVAPKPVNVLVSSPNPELSVARLTDLGVRRISVGSALFRVAWGAFMRAAKSIAETGSFDALSPSASFAELNALFSDEI